MAIAQPLKIPEVARQARILAVEPAHASRGSAIRRFSPEAIPRAFPRSRARYPSPGPALRLVVRLAVAVDNFPCRRNLFSGRCDEARPLENVLHEVDRGLKIEQSLPPRPARARVPLRGRNVAVYFSTCRSCRRRLIAACALGSLTSSARSASTLRRSASAWSSLWRRSGDLATMRGSKTRLNSSSRIGIKAVVVVVRDASISNGSPRSHCRAECPASPEDRSENLKITHQAVAVGLAIIRALDHGNLNDVVLALGRALSQGDGRVRRGGSGGRGSPFWKNHSGLLLAIATPRLCVSGGLVMTMPTV